MSIKSHWHHLPDALFVYETFEPGWSVENAAQPRHAWVSHVLSLPRVFVELPLVATVTANAHNVAASICTLQQAGLLALPFDAMLIEIDQSHMPKIGDSMRQTDMYIVSTGENGFVVQGMRLFGSPGSDRRLVLVDPYSFGLEFGPDYSLGLQAYRHTELSKRREVGDADVTGKLHAMRALLIALAFTTTKGVAAETVEPPAKLNKARERKGKTLFPSYTLWRVGHVYNRRGDAVSHGGKIDKVFWRRAHIRNQAYGPGYSKHKQILIDAVLVNYDPDSETPVADIVAR